MPAVIKVCILFLFYGWNLFPVVARGKDSLFADKTMEKIEWDNSLVLPDEEGKSNLGVAGAFSGCIGDYLIVAGGSNFPDKMPWEGGHKMWYDLVYVLNTAQPDSGWVSYPDALPRPLAYGSSIELPEGILCIGGCDSRQCYRDVFLLRFVEEKIDVDTDWPDLPVPLANATASLLDHKVYIAGGQSSMKEEEAGGYFFVLDLDDLQKGWSELPTWPGEPRGYAVSAVQSDGFDNCFYLFSGRNYRKDGYVKVLTDGYVYNPRLDTWGKLEPEFPVMAGTAFAIGTNHILFLGGVPQLIPGSMDHPGFDNTVRLYHTVTQTLLEKEVSPYPIAVTTHIMRKGNAFYIGSGEIKPGIRTPHLLKGEIVLSEKK